MTANRYNKYHNQKTNIDGITFDSKREAKDMQNCVCSSEKEKYKA